MWNSTYGVFLKKKVMRMSKKTNENNSIKLLSSTSIAILLLLSEKPNHAWGLKELMEKRGYEKWAFTKKSTIYKDLKSLQKEKYITSEKDEKGPSLYKLIYSLTKKGSEKMIEQVKLCITDAPLVKSMFDLGLSGLSYLTKSEAVAILEQYKLDQGFAIKWFEETLHDLDNLDKLVEIFPDKWVAGNTIKGHFDNKGINFIVRALFDRPYRIIKTQLAWLEEFIQSIKEDKGDFYFKEE